MVDILEDQGFDRKSVDTPNNRHLGFNKGSVGAGIDDDLIEVEFGPGEAPDGIHTCWLIEFKNDPVDLRLGQRRRIEIGED